MKNSFPVSSRQRRLLVIAASQSLTGGIERLTSAYVRAFEELGIEVSIAELGPDSGVRGRVAFVGRVIGELLRGAPFMVLASHIGFGRLIPVLRLLRPSIAACVLLHGLEVWDGPRRRQELLGVRSCDAVVAVSRYTKDRFTATWPRVPPARVILPAVPSPVSGTGVAPPASHRDGLARPLSVLCVSRLQRVHRQKGVAELIAAVAQVNRRGFEVSLRVVGEGDDRPALEALAHALDAERMVSFLGRIDDAQLDLEYERAGAFALPSEQEGFGLVYLEAMSHGLPVVALDLGPIPEVVPPHAGVLLESRTVEHIAGALITLANDEQLRERMGRAARAHVRENFGHDRFLGAVGDLLTAMGGRAH